MAYRPYTKGYQFELRVKKYLEKRRFFVVRSAGSHGIFDLVAVRDGRAYGIQCKVNRMPGRKEIDEMIDAYVRYGIIPLAAIRRERKIEWVDIVSGFVSFYIDEILTGEKD